MCCFKECDLCTIEKASWDPTIFTTQAGGRVATKWERSAGSTLVGRVSMISAMRLGSSPDAAAAAASPVCFVSGILGMWSVSYSDPEYKGSTSGPNGSFALSSFSAALSDPDRNDAGDGMLSPP